MLGDVQSEFLQATSQYRKICLMITAMNRAFDNIPSGLMTRLGGQRLPIWNAYLSGANAWIEITDAEVVQETLASQCICELQWSRWEERFSLASVTADNRGLPKLSEATLRVATQIRSAMEKVAAQGKFLLTYMKVSRGQAGLTRAPSINVVTTLH